MINYLYRRLLQSILLLIGVIVIVFFMIRISCDPVSLMISREATAEQRQAFIEANGFDRSTTEQFIDFMSGALLRADLGDSLQYRVPATDLIMQRLPATFELAFASLIFALSLAIPLGMLAGLFPNSIIDFIARMIALIGQSVPNFWLAMLLIFFIAVPVDFFPTFGRRGFESLLLPMFALGLSGVGQLVRLTRATVMEVRSEDFVRTARAKGLSPRAIAVNHVLRNAALPLVSVVGIQFTYLLGGSVYIETIFSWPGLGTLLEGAITNRDFPLVQAITFFIAIFAISINLIADLAYMMIDPRIWSA